MPSTLDAVFAETPTASPLHPRLRGWKARIDKGDEAKLEIYQEGTAIGIGQTEMYLHFTSKNESPKHLLGTTT